MLLSTAFFPPVSWFAAAAEDWGRAVVTSPSSVCDVYLDACENYCKQSYRNRCVIASANGPEVISVPVKHDGDIYHMPITSIQVDYSDGWVKKAERAIESAYSGAAFFEYYKDDVFDILDSRIPSLWDLNLAVINYFIGKIHLGIRIVPFRGSVPSEGRAAHGNVSEMGPSSTIGENGVTYVEKDYRQVIHPKRENTVLRDLKLEKPYFQVFAGKYGFKSDLSVMDLLFNEGPQSILYVVPALR